jgi:hypothetical protein
LRWGGLLQEGTHQQLGKNRADVGLVRQRHQNPDASLSSFHWFAEADKESGKVFRKQILAGRQRVSKGI